MSNTVMLRDMNCGLKIRVSGVRNFPSAPLLHLNRPDTLVFRLPTQSAGESLILARAIIYFRD